MTRLLSWNVNRHSDFRESIPADVDVVLLQEAPASVGAPPIEHSTGPAVVVRCSDAVDVKPLELIGVPAASADRDAYPVTYPGTLAVSKVVDDRSSLEFYAASVYTKWEKIGGWIVSDVSAHRIISDLSALITTERHATPLIVAGDWNMFRGVGETPYWRGRYKTVFDRMEALGLSCVGPFHTKGGGIRREPDANAQLDGELPEDNAATYHTHSQTKETAWRQLDFVFASDTIADRVKVRALNSPEEWGPSDHCRIIIDIA